MYLGYSSFLCHLSLIAPGPSGKRSVMSRFSLRNHLRGGKAVPTKGHLCTM